MQGGGYARGAAKINRVLSQRRAAPASPSKLNNPQPRRMRDGVGAAGGVELVDEGGDMKLDRMDRNAEAAGDRLFGDAFGEMAEHFAFARRQSAIRPGRRRRPRRAKRDIDRLARWRQAQSRHVGQ